MRICKPILLLTLVFVSSASVLAQPGPTQPQQAQILRIISNPVIWRKDFVSVLRTLNDLKKIGESSVAVYTNQAEGTRTFSLATTDALKEAAELRLLMQASKSEFKPEIRERLSALGNVDVTTLSPKAQPVTAEALAAVVLTEKETLPAELLSTGLTPALLKEQIGEPESTTTKVIDTGDEQRPEILTLYHYAGNSIVFAVADMSKTPGLIDRAFLDTHKVSELIFRP